MPFTLKKVAMRLRNNSEYIPLPGVRGEDGADGVSPAVSFTTITGGHTMTVTDKDHPSGQSINIMDGTSGGGGTSDYDDLTDKPSINGTTLSGNKTAAELGLAAASDIPTVPVQSVNGKTGAVVLSASDVGAGTYSKPSGGIPKSDLASAVQNKLDKTVVVSDTQPTATENKLWVDTDAGAGSSYQVPTVAEMEAADNTILGNLAMIESSPATAAHAVGEYIVLNGHLYKVTAAIAAGQTLTVGTNIEAVTLGDAVKILNDKDKTYRVATGINSINVFLKGNLALLSVTGFQFTASARGWYQITTLPAIAHPTSFTVFTGFDNLADNVLLECRVEKNGGFYVYAWAAQKYELRCNAFYFTSEDGTI